MPLEEVSLNRGRGWSLDSFDSADDLVTLPPAQGRRPDRIHDEHSETRAQNDDGFARFLKQHSSPTHQRVTAGGYIVPMQPALPPPPQFHLLTDNVTHDDAASQPKKAGDHKRASKRSSSGSNTAVPSKAGRPTEHDGHHSQISNSSRTRKTGDSQNNQVNTAGGSMQSIIRMPRPVDISHWSSAADPVLPHSFTDVGPSFDLNSQTFPLLQRSNVSFPASSMVFDPYANMLIPSGEQPPMVRTPLVFAPPFTSGAGVDQMGYTNPYGWDFGQLAQDSVQPGLWPSYNPSMPTSSISADLLQHPGITTSQNATFGMASAYNNIRPPNGIGTDPYAQGHISGTANSSDHMDPMFNKANHDVSMKVAEEVVNGAERDFRELDFKLQGHDRYIASHHSTLNPRIKSYYVAERMKIVEQRDIARRQWMHLRGGLDQRRSDQRSMTASAQQQKTAPPKMAKACGTNQNSNRSFNVQAADWIPPEWNEDHGPLTQPSLAACDVTKPTNLDVPAAENSSAGIQHRFTGNKMGLAGENPCLLPANVQGSKFPSIPTVPGPYTRQLNSASGREPTDMEVDEWGVRRGFAPPQLAQKQNQEAIRLQHEATKRYDAPGHSRSSTLPPTTGSVTMTGSTPCTVDEWGARVGHAPPDLAQKQGEQNEKLVKMSQGQRKHMTIETLNNLPPASNSSGKTVSFVERALNSTHRPEHKPSAGEAHTVDSFGIQWKSTGSEEEPSPTQADWAAVLEASQMAKGVKTNVPLATGHFITIEGQGSTGLGMCTTDEKEGQGRSLKDELDIFDRDRSRNSHSLVNVGRGICPWEETAGRRGVSRLSPWADRDENNFFRHKGASSVALQSVTAQGMLPSVDGVVGRHSHRAAKFPSTVAPALIGSPGTSSPHKRWLRDIWSPTQTTCHVQPVDGKFNGKYGHDADAEAIIRR